MRYRWVASITFSLLALGLLQPAQPAATERTAGCTDGGGVRWSVKISWGTAYDAANGRRRSVTSASWTTKKQKVRTDSTVRTYGPQGALLQTLRKTATKDYNGGRSRDGRNPLDPPDGPGQSKVTVKVGRHGDGKSDCTVAFVQPGAPATPSPSGSPTRGVQFHGTWSSYTDAERARVLDLMKSAGVTWVRLDVSWAMLQPKGRGQFDTDWGVPFVDRVLKMITSRGMTPLVTFWLTPAWANGGAGKHVAPTRPADYATALGWAAAKWPRVGAWEVWNEPNLDGFWTGASPSTYTRLLCTAKRHNPEVRIVGLGVSYNDLPWIKQAYAAGAQGCFDVLSTHPYMAPAQLPPETLDTSQSNIWLIDHARAVRNFMIKQGDGNKPIWFTEFGWSTHRNKGGEANHERGVSEQQQADYLMRTLKMLPRKHPYVTHVFWYNERDNSTSNRQEDNYGLLRRDLTPKPAYTALKRWSATH